MLTAYKETEYRVFGALSFVLRIGEHCASLARLYAQTRTDCGAFITACNPFSRVVDDTVNANQLKRLAEELQQRSLIYFDGIGSHPSGGWTGEPGFFVLGLPLENAKTLGKKYRQNAIVWCSADAIPELILLQ
jgi:hypothetical protein